MIKLRLDILITLVVKLCLVTAEARYYPPKPILRGGNAEVLDILLRGNGNPEISTALSDNPKHILRIGNPAVEATHRNNPKPVTGGYPKSVIPIGNPAVAAMLRHNLRAILRGGNPQISVMLRDNPKPFLLAAIPEKPAMPRDKLKHNLLAGIPELSAMPHGNPKPNLHDGGSLKLLAMLREYIKPHLNNPARPRVRKDSESNRHSFLTSGINKYTINDNDLKDRFNKMVETVTKVNDERILTLKKFFELDNYLPQVSRTTKQKNPIIAIIMNTPNYKPKYDNLNMNHVTEDPQHVIVKKKHKEPSMLNNFKEIIDGTYLNHNEDDDEVDISQESDETFVTKYLRGWKSCNKSACKSCQKACKKAFKTVCYDYQCSKSFKKDGKKQCKKRCEASFINAADSSGSD